jgi:hypothetical protein
MKTPAVIADLDVQHNIIACFLPRRVNSAVNPLNFHGRAKGLGQRIVEASPLLPTERTAPISSRRWV